MKAKTTEKKITKPADLREETFGPYTLTLSGFGRSHIQNVTIGTKPEAFEDAGEELTDESPLTETVLSHDNLLGIIPSRAYLFTPSGVAKDVPMSLVDKIRKDLEKYAAPAVSA